MADRHTKSFKWVGTSYKDLKAMPEPVRHEIGYVLWRAQEGKPHHKTKQLKGLPGVMEIVCDYDTNTFRAVYTAQIGEVIYVLHCFQKKSKRGIATPKQELDVIRKRLQAVTQSLRENKS